MQKKAISPVITTVLLVLIAIVLAVIIFVWAVAFRGEQITKFSGGEEKDIRLSCDSVLFRPELIGTSQIAIVNTGDVPIYRFDIRIIGTAGTRVESAEGGTNPGQTSTIDVSTMGISSGTEIQVIPVLLGTDKDGAEKEASCINSGKWEVINA